LPILMGADASASTRGAVVVTRPLPPPGATPLADAGLVVDQLGMDHVPEPIELASHLAAADAAITTLGDRIDAATLASAPRLRIVANFAVGYDNVDLHAAAERGIVVTNTPDVLTEATADLAWALALAAARRVVEGDRWVRSGDWPGWAPDQMLGQSVHGATLAVVGMGRIGAAVARRATGFSMEILSVSRSPKPELEEAVGAIRMPLLEALARADVVVVTAPLHDSTHHLIDRAALDVMKPSAVLVNVGRGPVVDEAALVHALSSGGLAAAGLDVYEFEPAVGASLRALPNVVLAPHLGSATHAARAAMARCCCDNVLAVLRGDPPLTPVF
jgi:glyoxylate reductase